MSVSSQQRLGKALSDEFLNFIETHPPAIFSRDMRRTLLDYLQRQVDVGMPLYMSAFLHAMYDFFELMDAAETWQEQKAGNREHGQEVVSMK